jgi:hypothetical protein
MLATGLGPANAGYRPLGVRLTEPRRQAIAGARFKVESWDEQTYAELDEGRKLSRAHVTQAYSGGIEGNGEVEWLMCYRPDGTASFVGLERITGRVGELSGTFVLESAGTFDGREASADMSVVPGSGTEELSGLRGTGTLQAEHGGTAALVLDYELG